MDTTASVLLLIIVVTVLAISEQNSTFTKLMPKEKDQIDQVLNANRNNHMVVLWRRCLIISLLLSFFIYIFIYGTFIINFPYIIITMLIFMATYFTAVWFQAHWWRENNDKIERYILKLKGMFKRKK
jgi:hypothetical protein